MIATPTDKPRELRWYLIHCKPRQDERAYSNLTRQGFYCYRPIRHIERLRDGRRYLAGESLFPGYLFIQLDRDTDNWYPVRSTRGIHEIVRFNEYPLPVPDQLIANIRQRLEQHTAPRPYLQPGQRVRITDGPFAQLEAIFISSDGDQRVILLMNLLQKDQQLVFPLRSVRKA